MKLVVGLGNPGSDYVGTRHNIGWEVVDRLAVRLGWIGKSNDFDRMARINFQGLTMDGIISVHDSGATEKVLLLKPNTYMNLSGSAVLAAMSFYRLELREMIVVLDDLALPCGKLRIRPGGSSGGHNGLRDIEAKLGQVEYPRLRVGIDSPPPPIRGKDYVLGKFTPAQRTKIEPAIDRAASAILTWMNEGMTWAMNKFNAEEKETEDRNSSDRRTGQNPC